MKHFIIYIPTERQLSGKTIKAFFEWEEKLQFKE